MNDEKAWVRTWARTPKETIDGYRNFAWSIDEDFSDVHEHAYLSDREKAQIVKSYLASIERILSKDQSAAAEQERTKVLAIATNTRRTQKQFEVWF